MASGIYYLYVSIMDAYAGVTLMFSFGVSDMLVVIDSGQVFGAICTKYMCCYRYVYVIRLYAHV